MRYVSAVLTAAAVFSFPASAGAQVDAPLAESAALSHKQRAVRPHRPWLRSLGWCESKNRLRAIGGGGAFRGKYQFSMRTWYAAGGRGDPINASELEQSYRAVKWARIIGWNNVHTTMGWPVCG